MATNPKVVGLINRYLESYKGEQVSYNIDNNEQPRGIDNIGTGGLDQIVENDEEEEEVQSIKNSLAFNKFMSLQPDAS